MRCLKESFRQGRNCFVKLRHETIEIQGLPTDLYGHLALTTLLPQRRSLKRAGQLWLAPPKLNRFGEGSIPVPLPPPPPLRFQCRPWPKPPKSPINTTCPRSGTVRDNGRFLRFQAGDGFFLQSLVLRRFGTVFKGSHLRCVQLRSC